MDIDLQKINGENFDRYAQVLSLLRASFAYMEGRIDPPSSLHRIGMAELIDKACAETLVVACDGDEVVGCVFAAVQPACMYLGKLAVDASYRGQGIARRLIAHVEAQAAQVGTGCVELETRVELVENQRLFEWLGYVKVAENSHPGYQRVTSFRYRKVV